MQGWIFSRETEGVCEYDSELSLVTVSIDDKLLHEAGATNISAVRQVGNLDNLLVQLALSAEKFNAGEKIYRETMIRALAAQIATTITPPVTQLSKLDDQRLRRAIEHIHARLGEDLSLENLSIEAGMSSFHFARSFKAATGTSPLQYVILTRMKTAQTLLASTKLSITEIAHRVGYEDVSRFIQHFRLRIGVSPGEIRKR